MNSSSIPRNSRGCLPRTCGKAVVTSDPHDRRRRTRNGGRPPPGPRGQPDQQEEERRQSDQGWIRGRRHGGEQGRARADGGTEEVVVRARSGLRRESSKLSSRQVSTPHESGAVQRPSRWERRPVVESACDLAPPPQIPQPRELPTGSRSAGRRRRRVGWSATDRRVVAADSFGGAAAEKEVRRVVVQRVIRARGKRRDGCRRRAGACCRPTWHVLRFRAGCSRPRTAGRRGPARPSGRGSRAGSSPSRPRACCSSR